MGIGVSLIVFFLLEWFYPVVFELLWDGATPAKRLLGLRVINDNGTPVDLSASVIRNLLRAVDFLPLFYTFGILSMMIQRDFKRLGDLAAGTVVIYREPRATPTQLSEGPAEAPPHPLSNAEGRLLIDFAERGGQLSSARQQELAQLLLPQHPQAVQQLLAQARWLLGQQGGVSR